jgi:hypothetical protein
MPRQAAISEIYNCDNRGLKANANRLVGAWKADRGQFYALCMRFALPLGKKF